MPQVLIDTNILVYTIDARDPDRQENTLSLITRLSENHRGCLSVQNLAEFASAAINKLSLPPVETLRLIENWQLIFPVLDLTPRTVLEAVRGVRDHQFSYYDSQIWAVALLNKVPLVFSEDFQNGQVLEGVQFLNPLAPSFRLEDFLC